MNFFVKFILIACSRSINRIITCEAAIAAAESVVHQLPETFHRQIAEAVSSDILCYLFRGMTLACNEILFGVYIRSEVTGVQKRRRRDTDVHLFSACFAEKPHDTGTSSAADYRIVYHYDTLALNALTDCVQLYLYSVLALILVGLNEASSDVFILDEADTVGYAAGICIAQSRVKSRIGNSDDDISIYGTVLCKELPCFQPCVMNGNAFDDRIGTRKVDVLENADMLFISAVSGYRAQTVLIYDHYLPCFNVAYELRAYCFKGAGLRSNNIGAVMCLAYAQRTETVRIAECYKLGRRHKYTGVSSLYKGHCTLYSLLGGAACQSLADNRIGYRLGVRCTVEYSSRHLEGTAELRRIDKVAVVDKSHIALDVADNKGLDIVVVVTARCGIADVSNCHITAAQLVKLLTGKDLGYQSVSPFMAEHTVVADGYSAALLPSVLKSVQTKIYRSSNIGCFILENAENSAFFETG